MAKNTKVFISDPVGRAYRSEADHNFIIENMHMPLFRQLRKHNLEPDKREYTNQTSNQVRLSNHGALILLGGFDINENYYRYGTDSWSIHPDVDAYELDLIYEAVGRGIPVLGICRGLQLINVFANGTLHRDISHLSNIDHNNFGAPAYGKRATVHELQIQDSLLLDSGTYNVASSHHQAIDELGWDLTVTGCSPDGIIEMVEDEHQQLFGVQWHPESRHVAQSDTLTSLISGLADRVN